MTSPFIFAVTVAVLYAGGAYMLLRRSFVKLVIGLVLLGHGTNLLIFTSGGLVKTGAPLIPDDQKVIRTADGEIARAGVHFTDPLPPALILTAIVISFAIVSFAIVLVKRAYQEIGTDDLAQMRGSDRG